MATRIFSAYIVLVLLLLFSACEGPKSFGEQIDESGAITVDELVLKLSSEKEFKTKVKGKIHAACKEEGCWLEFQSNAGENILVSYKDGTFTLPVGIEGRTVVVQGIAYVDSVTVDEQKEEAKEEGKSLAEIESISATEYSLALEATGVLFLD